MTSRKAVVIYHAKSGRAADHDLDRVLGQVSRLLCEKANYAVELLPLGPQLNEHVAEADLVVAVGGDGTVRSVFAMMVESGNKAPVAIIPVGTGNLYARYLGLRSPQDRDLTYALNVMLSGEAVPIELGRMNGTYFAIDAGVGPLSTAIVAPRPSLKSRWKMLAYIGPLLQAAIRKPVRFRITADGDSFEVSAKGVFVTTFPEYELGNPLRMVHLNDGKLHLCILNPRNVLDYWRIFARAFPWMLGLGRERDVPSYMVRKVKNLSIEVCERHHIRYQKLRRYFDRQGGRKQLSAMVDGDRCGSTPMHIDAVAGAVMVVVPQRMAYRHYDYAPLIQSRVMGETTR